jgi:hypothetical protein
LQQRVIVVLEWPLVASDTDFVCATLLLFSNFVWMNSG